jgi:hypothetical protein
MDKNCALETRLAAPVTDGIESKCTTKEPGEIRLRTRLEAAGFLKISLNTIDRLRYQRKLACYQIGGSIRFCDWDLMEFVTDKLVMPEQLIRDQNRILNKVELARFLNLSTRSVEHLVIEKRLWHRKTGRIVRFHLGDVLIQLATNFRVAAQHRD